MSLNPDSITTAGEPAIEPAVAESSDEQLVTNHGIWDRVGIFGSALCLAHCLAMPLAVGYLSAAGLGFLGTEIVHKLLAGPLLLIALLAFIPGFRRHGDLRILGAGAAGVALLITAIFVLEPFISHDVETALTITGSVILIGAHTANWRRDDQPNCC